MSLVDYEDSSSDDDVLAEKEDSKQKEAEPSLQQRRSPKEKASPAQSFPRITQTSVSSLNQQEVQPTIEKLPDALLLLDSPTLTQVSGNDHASRVAAAMAESALRKRDLNGHPSSLPRTKLPRGNLRHSKSIPETVGGVLVPPQLKGRSNVATEDISRLFVRKQQESSKEKSSSN